MAEFYKGMDISFVPQLLAEEGMEISDLDGSIMNPFLLVKKYGVNSIRLRIWNNPENVPEAKGYCNFQHTLNMAKEIKSHGLGFMLDFHYSDHWADPGQQRKPKAWEGLSREELEEAVYTYTRDTLQALKEEGVLPGIVQIGNEIRSGLLFPEGELPDYEGMVRLINAGIRGAREVAGKDEMQIMIHLDQGGRYFYLKEWFDQAMAHGLSDFDIIGLSYYAFWHGTFTDLKESMEKLVKDYGKPIIVAETAHAWRRSKSGFIDEDQERIAGFPATPEGQRKVLDLVMNITASLPDQMGMGVYYWEPLCIPREGDGGWSDNMGILDEKGKVHESVKAFLFTREQQCFTKVAKIYEPQKMLLQKGTKPILPKQLNVLYYDGRLERHPVKWLWEEASPEGEGEYLNNPGKYRLTGILDKTDLRAYMEIEVVEELKEYENLIQDANWEEGLNQWILEKSDDRVEIHLCPEQIAPFPAPTVNYLQVESPLNFQFTIRQDVTIQNPGRYGLKVEYRGTDTTNVDVKLFMEAHDSSRGLHLQKEQVIHPTDNDWVLYELGGVECFPGVLTVGVRISAPPIFGKIRCFELIQESGE